MSNTIGTYAIILFIVVLFISGLSFISYDISKNTYLDDDSVNIISDLNLFYSDLNPSIVFTPDIDPSIANSTFEGVDAYSREYLETKTDSKGRENIVMKILTLPAIPLKVFGVTSYPIIISFSVAFSGIILFLIGLSTYKAIRTGEVD